MLKRSLILLLAVVLTLAACSENKKMIAEKDQEIARLQQEIADLRSEADTLGKAKDKLAEDLGAKLDALKQKEQIWIQEKEDMTSIGMSNAILFASGSNELTSEGKGVIDQIWTVLSQYPDRQIIIQGHTDNIVIGKKLEGRFKSNWELSSARAIAVLNYVLLRPDSKPGRLAAAGYGEYHPIADNSTSEGRAKNRRVVITISGKG